QLQQVTVGIPEIKPAPTTPIVELAVIRAFRRAAIGEPCRLDAIEDGIEFGIAHVKGVVVDLERVSVVEQQRRLIVHAHRCEVADALALQAEDLGEEACGRRLVVNRNDGVVEDDRHVMPPRWMLSRSSPRSSPSIRRQTRSSAGPGKSLRRQMNAAWPRRTFLQLANKRQYFLFLMWNLP